MLYLACWMAGWMRQTGIVAEWNYFRSTTYLLLCQFGTLHFGSRFDWPMTNLTSSCLCFCKKFYKRSLWAPDENCRRASRPWVVRSWGSRQAQGRMAQVVPLSSPLVHIIGFELSPKGIQANAQHLGCFGLVLISVIIGLQYMSYFYLLKWANRAIFFRAPLF